MKKLIIFIAFVSTFILLNSFNRKSLEGDWMTLDSNNEYCELFFSKNKIQIFHEITGYISPKNYEITNDSLLSEIGDYKILWLNADSVHLASQELSIIMKRIKSGNTLGEYIENKKEFDQSFKDDFWTRMKTWKELPF